MTLIHEVNARGQHRIVIVNDDKEVNAGEWSEAVDLAVNGKFFGNSDPGNGLPPGIFQVKEFTHQVLA